MTTTFDQVPPDILADLAASVRAAKNDLAMITERLQASLPTYVEQHSSQVFTSSPSTITLPPLAGQLVRIRGFLASFPAASGVTQFRVQLTPDLIIDVNNGGLVMSDMAMTVFSQSTNTPKLTLSGTALSSSNTSYATLWVWGEQVPATGMLS